ncbi:hypothetical protein [Bacillus timonensis]|uniref:hypothetical protein n=1 Tax=Bacillus timonensis TaxID=1033734 RepID=UPI0002F5A1CF|nr:hypothetical protein [Bacillus timonensis]
MNIVLYSTIPSDLNGRANFTHQLERGRKRMGNWKQGKQEVLALFEGGIVNNV